MGTFIVSILCRFVTGRTRQQVAFCLFLAALSSSSSAMVHAEEEKVDVAPAPIVEAEAPLLKEPSKALPVTRNKVVKTSPAKEEKTAPTPNKDQIRAEATDAVEKAGVPSPEKLAEELGYKASEFKKAVSDFAVALSQGSQSQALKRICAKDEDTCGLLQDFQRQSLDGKRERKRNRNRVKRFRINEDNIQIAQRFDFHILANSLKVEDEYRLFDLAEKSLKESDCPRNLSAALAVKAEEYFPLEKARQISKQLFDHARPCLQNDMVVFERLHLRQALISLYEGNKERAKDLLLVAKTSKNPTERYRVLYWLGRLEHQQDVSPKDNKAWNELMTEFPLSYYAIDAAVATKVDPMEMITQRKMGGLKRDVPSDVDLNRQIRWLEALYVFKNPGAVAKWASWIVRSNEEELEVGVLNYISTLKVASGMYRSNIQMLFSYFRKNPQALNQEGLKLLYPRPYYNMIQDASKGRIDTLLVLGLVRQESAFDPRAVSRAKAKGLMQIIPGTARRLASQGHRKLMNEKDNTQMGVKYLVQLSERFEGQVELVLAAYNAGPNKVDEWLKRNPNREADPLLWNDLIPFMETRDYVVSILRNNYLYARIYGEPMENPSGKVFASSLVKGLLAADGKKK